MRIKTDVNKKVEGFVAEHWPEKWVNFNYKDDSSRMRDENRWIQISTPLDSDHYIHYEVINNHIELHFEDSGTKDLGISANQNLVDYLEQITETDTRYEWSDFLNGESIRCVYKNKITDCEDMLVKLQDVIGYFDPIIEKYQSQSFTAGSSKGLQLDDSLLPPAETIELEIMKLRDVLVRNLHIPDYQRIYCWEERNVKCLLDDLLLHIEQQDQTTKYRLGTIILHYHDSEYDIIDGQQRLVTLALLLNELGLKTCLLEQKFESSEAIRYVGYNKYIIENYVRKHIADRAFFSNALLSRIEFNVLVLCNSSLDLAYTFFSNENSRGVKLTDYDLLKAHHLRFIPETFEPQSRKAAETWNRMINEGRKTITDEDPKPDYEKTLDSMIYNLRQWMRMGYEDTFENDRHVKREYEAAPIMPDLPPFGERFHFNEPIQGGTHFFSFVQIHLANYRTFEQTPEYKAVHRYFMGKGSIQWYRNAIEALLFGYYEKFGEHCLADASVLIMRFLLQNRFETVRAQKSGIYKYVSERGVILMIDQSTSPTFFLAELYNIIRDFPVVYLQDMKPIQRSMRRNIIDIKNELTPRIYVESIKNIKL